MVNALELIGITEYLMLQTSCRINRCRYNGVRLYLSVPITLLVHNNITLFFSLGVTTHCGFVFTAL